MNWKCCCSCRVFISYHVEIEDLLVFVLDDDRINAGSWSWINAITSRLFEKSSGHSFVDKDVKQVRIVALLEGLDCLTKLARGALESKAVLLHSWASNAISINDDLHRNLSIVSLFVICEGIDDKLHKET